LLETNTVKPSALANALALYRKAESLDGEQALLAYRIARVLDRLGRRSEALESYRRARDLDICPLRIISPHEAVLTRLAAETKTPLLEVGNILAANIPGGIPGNDCYLDHVHPTIRGQQLIAQAIAGKLREIRVIPNGQSWAEEKRREAYQRQLDSLGPGYFADGLRRVAWLENWARRQRLFDETLPNDALGYLRLGFKRLELGQEDEAWDAFDEALKRDQALTPLLKEHAQELLSGGRPLAASNLLEKLNARRE